MLPDPTTHSLPILSKGPSDLCVHRPSSPWGLNPQQSSELCSAQSVTQFQEKMWDWEYRYAGIC